MKKRKLRLDRTLFHAGRLARFLFKSQLLTIFLLLCALGLGVGLQTRPDPDLVPWGEMFEGMSVVSFRDSPTDTTARFVVQLAAGGKIFSQYDVDARAFLPPPRGRDYSRNITGTQYRPLRVRGHVASGFWLDVPTATARRALLPGQFEELYRSTLDFVKPFQVISGTLGLLSGYSVGFRLGHWNGSLRSRSVQERVLATPGLGPALAREAWRRVLLEPVVMADENDAARFAALAGTHRLYAGFFRTALNDSDGFIPREAARLAAAGGARESRAMLAFAASVRRAANDTVHLKSSDFAAIERWAALLDRNGHWATGSMPRSGEERVRLLGVFAWYGLAPPAPEVTRVWIGSRLLVREAESEGFVTDEIPGTATGCPIAWRDRLREEHTGAKALANAWLSDRPEFVALFELGQRGARAAGDARRHFAAWQREQSERARRRRLERAAAAARAPRAATVPAGSEPAPDMPGELTLHAFGDEGRLVLPAAEAEFAAALGRVVQATLERGDSLVAASARPVPGDHPAPQPEWDAALRGLGVTEVTLDSTSRPARATWSGVPMTLADVAAAGALDAAADSLRALGVHNALLELSDVTVAIGAPPPPGAWRIAVADPRGRVATAAWLKLEPGDAAAAARTDRAGSDPPVTRPAAVVVLAPAALSARAWRTELLALPLAEARRVARERDDLSAVLVEAVPGGPDVLWVESDVRDQFELDASARGLFRVEYF